MKETQWINGKAREAIKKWRGKRFNQNKEKKELQSRSGNTRDSGKKWAKRDSINE